MTPAQLRQRRIALGLTHERFAAVLRVNATDVARWEAGTPPLPDGFVLALATAYVELAIEADSRREVLRSIRREEADDRELRP